MSEAPIQLLDCTLRDGGYINDWKWGNQEAKSIIALLVKAGIDVVEVGFLRNVEKYCPDITACSRIEELNDLLPEKCGNTIFSAMAMQSNYSIENLSTYSGQGIEMIRVTAHDYDIDSGLEFAAKVKEKGYKVSINPINIMGYTDNQLLHILDKVNEIQPYQFSVVDTFGSMKRRDLDRIISLADHNLSSNIRLALHLHENMSLSTSLAQSFIDKNLDRPIAIDGSLMGMGRTPGNLPIELIADYLNDYQHCAFDIDYLMDAIQDYIAPLKGAAEWGYNPAYFLAARFNLHRNYAEHFLAKGDLTTRDINHILSQFDDSKATVFDREYADKMYEEYEGNKVDDSKDREALRESLKNREILVLVPGRTLVTHRSAIDNYIRERQCLVFSINFYDEGFPNDYVFFGNSRRYCQAGDIGCKTIVTSNITGRADYCIDYNSVSGAFAQGCNTLFLALKLLQTLDVAHVALAGADGYVDNRDNYYRHNMKGGRKGGMEFNREVKDALANLRMDIRFITPSKYNE